MPYFYDKQNNLNLLFVHIPKTGGTSVEKYLSVKYSIELNTKSLYTKRRDEHGKFHSIIPGKENKPLQHIVLHTMIQYNETLNIFFDNTIKIFTVVRNPYDRLVSDLFFFDLIKTDSTKDYIYKQFVSYIKSNVDNHGIPQSLFIINPNTSSIFDNVVILKTETLTNDMREFGFIDFNNFEQTNNKKHKPYIDYLNKNSIDLINKYYHMDFINFGYTKIFKSV